MATQGKKFKKSQIVASERYRIDRDILEAILDDKKEYSCEEIEKEIKTYLEKGVR